MGMTQDLGDRGSERTQITPLSASERGGGRMRRGWRKGVGSRPSGERFSHILRDASESPGGV